MMYNLFCILLLLSSLVSFTLVSFDLKDGDGLNTTLKSRLRHKRAGKKKKGSKSAKSGKTKGGKKSGKTRSKSAPSGTIVDVKDPPDMLSEVAMENLGFIAHNAVQALELRGFSWGTGAGGGGKKKKGKGRKKKK